MHQNSAFACRGKRVGAVAKGLNGSRNHRGQRIEALGKGGSAPLKAFRTWNEDRDCGIVECRESRRRAGSPSRDLWHGPRILSR
jgi:hypothetical protein